jgi:hypothetical protein
VPSDYIICLCDMFVLYVSVGYCQCRRLHLSSVMKGRLSPCNRYNNTSTDITNYLFIHIHTHIRAESRRYDYI